MPEITRGVYNLGNPLLANWINNFNRSSPSKPYIPPSDVDIVVIGGGITGTYMARRLSSQFPSQKILLIEKSNRIGGRYLSSYLGTSGNPYNTALEYGGMRIFSSIQPRITKLVELLGLTLVAVPYVAPNNLFSGRTRTFLNSNLFPNTKEVYFLEPSEENEVVFNTVNSNIYSIFEEYGVNPNPLYEPRLIAFQNPELSSLCFRNEVTQGPIQISTEDYRRFSNITGYTGFFYGNGNFASLSYENISLNGFDETQYFVEEGFELVPQTCIDPFNIISFNNLKNKNFVSNNLLLMDTELLSFSPTNNNRVKMTVSNGGETFSFDSKKLYITTPVDKLQSIEGFPDEYNNKFVNTLTKIPLFKIFLYYETNWWNDYGFSIGRSTTDMPIDQVWFYNDNTLMVYAVREDAEFWAPQLPYPEQFDLINVTSPYPSFLTYLMSFIKKVFKDYTDVPFPDKIGWKYWDNGGFFWNGINFNSSDKSIYDIEMEMIYIYGNDGNVNYLSYDISLNQGWGEGSIEIIDQFLKDKYNMPGILEIDHL